MHRGQKQERTYEQTDNAIRELSSDECSTAELEEVAGLRLAG
jgi:hypothetical protein